VEDHPRGVFALEGVVFTKGRFYKIDQDTLRSFASNVLLDILDANIKLMTSLQLVIK
jgi:hypothetical protein